MTNPKPPIEAREILNNLRAEIEYQAHNDNGDAHWSMGNAVTEALAALNRAYGEQMLGLVGEDEIPAPSKCTWALEDKCGCGHYIRNKLRAKLRAAIHKQFLGDK